MNIQLNYLYRDAGNYKVFGSVIFSNPDQLSLSCVEQSLRKKFIDSIFFDPTHLQVPRLQHMSFDYDSQLDHSWNEFESLEETQERVTDPRTISELLK